MSVKKVNFYILFFLITNMFSIIRSDLQDSINSLKNSWDGGKNFVEGMVRGIVGSVGVCFEADWSHCVYSPRIWNDSPGVIFVAKQDLTKVLGAGFSGGLTRQQALWPYTDTGAGDGSWWHEDLNFILWLLRAKNNGEDEGYSQYKTKVKDYAAKGSVVPGFGSAIGALAGSIVTTEEMEKYSFFDKKLSQSHGDPDNWYYYRAYTYQGQLKGEYLGIKTTTPEFNGVFYNSSKEPITLEFAKDSQNYKVLLEAGTFSLLNSSSSVTNSIRPPATQERAFTFYQADTVIAAMPIRAEGICNMQEDATTKKMVPGAPMVYTYEIADTQQGPQVSLQGLAIGNYDQPFDTTDPQKSVVRDINPMHCHFWYQSAAQAQAAAKSDQLYLDIPVPLWIFYKTADYSYQQKVKPEDVIDFSLIRPRLSEKNAWLYVVGIQTTDDTKAVQFLTRLADGVIGQDLKEPVTAINNFNENMVLVKTLPNTHGLIDDSAGSGVKGFVLLADNVTPRGVGYGPFYYQINPCIVQLDQLASLLSSYLNSSLFASADAMNQEINKKITQWVKLYPTDNKTVASQLTDLLTQKGIDQIITNTAAPQRTLNEYGKQGVTTLTSGPVSIANIPTLYQAGSNLYVYNLGAVPAGWPSK